MFTEQLHARCCAWQGYRAAPPARSIWNLMAAPWGRRGRWHPPVQRRTVKLRAAIATHRPPPALTALLTQTFVWEPCPMISFFWREAGACCGLFLATPPLRDPAKLRVPGPPLRDTRQGAGRRPCWPFGVGNGVGPYTGVDKKDPPRKAEGRGCRWGGIEAAAGAGAEGQGGFYCPPWSSPAPPFGCAVPRPLGWREEALQRAVERGCAVLMLQPCRILRRRPRIGRAR